MSNPTRLFTKFNVRRKLDDGGFMLDNNGQLVDAMKFNAPSTVAPKGLNLDFSGAPKAQSNAPTSTGFNAGAVAGTTAGIGDAIIDATNQPNEFGHQSVGSSVGKGALSGAALGTSILPGWGTAVGAVAGAAVGLINGKKNQHSDQAMRQAMQQKQQQNELSYSRSVLAADPGKLVGYGDSQMFAKGGTMLGRRSTFGMKKYAYGGTIENHTQELNPITEMAIKGGDAKKLSRDNTLIVGPSHEQGGVSIPALGSELEGGETTKDNFVFSKRLGFAQLHKPIAIAKGKIELKPQTKERLNSMKLLNDREGLLANQQESLKQMMGI
jgi:hypothetical protein